jgi:hypothetical protein
MNTKTLRTIILAILLTASLLFNARADITTSLQGYWTFDAGSGSSAADSSGNANAGTLTNFADTGFTTMWVNGIISKALIFNQNGETTNYVSVPNSTSINAGQVAREWTLSCWVKPSVAGGSQTGNAGIIAKGKLGLEEYSLYITGGKFQTRVRNAAGTGTMTATSTTTPSANQWYHVIGIIKEPRQAGLGSEGLLYVNGVKESATDANTFTTTFSSTEPLVIGAREDASGNVTLPFQGIIDEVRVYSRALTNDIWQLYTNGVTSLAIATEPRNVNCYSNDTAVFSVTADSKTILPLNYQWWFTNGGVGTLISSVTNSSLNNTLTLAGVTNGNAGTYTVIISNAVGTVVASTPATLAVRSLPPPDTTSGLVGWWKFDETSGSTAADSTANANAGALANFVDTGFTTMWDSGILGGALTFNQNGENTNVVVIPGIGTPAPAVLDFNASPVFTLSAWVKGNAQTSGGIIAKGTGGGGEQYCLEINAGNYRMFVRDTNGVSYVNASAASPNTVWQHVAAVFNATNALMNLYVNGALVASGLAPSSLQANSHEVSIGSRQPGAGAYTTSFSGALDDVRIYSRDLTSADVFSLYAVGAFPLIAAQYPVTYTNLYTLYAGSSPTFRLVVTGLSPLSYQWYTNGVAVADGTNASYQAPSLTVGGLTNYCVVTNVLGSITSSVWTAAVVAAPSAPYAQSVMSLNPLAYWRLDEADDTLLDGNPGAVAHDYWNGNDGFYTNATLGTAGYGQGLAARYGYTPPTDAETALQTFTGADSGALGIQNVDFATTNGASKAFSISAWARASSAQTTDAGIVTKGFSGSEQFNLDCGNDTAPVSHGFRFFVRNAAGTVGSALSSQTLPNDLQWHHLVGVCDQPNGSVKLYVDGTLAGSGTIATNSGIKSSSELMSIGTRKGGTSASSHYTFQFVGYVNDVTIYNSALGPAQVQANYLAAGLPPAITQNPVSSTNVDEGTTLTVPAQTAGGTPPVAMQWYDVTGGQPGIAIANQTNATLVISNISAALYNGHSLALGVSNAYVNGTPIYSSTVYVTVTSGSPVVTVNPSSVSVYAGTGVVFKATTTGTEPFSYQWSTNSVAVPGATTASYTGIAAPGTTTITCTVTNVDGPGSASATLTGVALPSGIYPLAILADGPVAYWRLNEAVSAPVAYDYVGGHNAVYNNAVNGLAGFSTGDPDTATGFGMGFANFSMALEQNIGGITPIDFSTAGSNASYSVEAWIKAPPGQKGGAGIVTRGFGGLEQFDLDIFGNAFRFFGHDSLTNTHGPTSSFVADGAWHHLAGVYDGSNGLVNLFVDGVVKGRTTMTKGLGVLAVPDADALTSIGSRMSGPTDGAFSFNLTNTVLDEVALYAYALSTNQVVAHFTNGPMAPQFVKDLASQVYVYEGFPITLSVQASSPTPMSYQWQRYGTNLTDGVGVSGSQTNTLTLNIATTNDSGATYQVFVTNATGTAASTLATLTALPQLQFNGFGTEWKVNGAPAAVPQYIAPNVLRLTDGNGSEACSSFFGYPVYIGSGFLATYTYQDVGGAGADGMAFVVQNNPNGAAALGGAGGGFGYNGMTNSAAVEFNIFANNGVGFAMRTNGVTGTPYSSASPVNLASGDPINVTLLYANGVLSMTLTDVVAAAGFTFSTNLNIVSAVGTNVAYVGFTGGAGSVTSMQTISNFNFISLVSPSLQLVGSNVVISWPAAAGGGYRVQQSSSLGGAWTDVGTTPVIVSGSYQVTLAALSSGKYYRLINP